MSEVGGNVNVRPRWMAAAAGLGVLFLLGTVYGWSVFKNPLLALHGVDGWTPAGVTAAFAIFIFFLGFSAAMGGKLVDSAGAPKVVAASAILYGLGNFLGGVADITGNIWILWLGYGVVGGIGNGLGYITPIAVLMRWFPDKKGLISGMAVMGFGLGGALTGQVAPLLFKVPQIGISGTFFLLGGMVMVCLLLASKLLDNPPAGWVAPIPGGALAKQPEQVSMEPGQAFRTVQFYQLSLILFINVTAGIMIVGNLSPMSQRQCGLEQVAAGTMVALANLCNGFGRVFWGGLSDRIGKRTTFLVLFSTQIPLFLLLDSISSPWVFGLMSCYILLCFGGGFGTMPSFAAETFGPKNVGAIYGKILLGWSLAGVVGTMLFEYLMAQDKVAGSAMALRVAAGLLAAGFVLALLFRKPAQPPVAA